MADAKIHILAATMTGTAEMVAEDIDARYPGRFTKPQAMDTLTLDSLSGFKTCLIVSSTYGEGEVPTTALPFYDQMASAELSLHHLRFGLIALGDYGLYPDTFAAGGDRWNEVFTKAKAQRVGEILKIDASSAINPVEAATDWVAAWLDAVDRESRLREAS